MVARANILEQVINPQEGDMSPDLARYILTLDFPPKAHARYSLLATKAQEDMLSAVERAELEEFLKVNNLLTIIQSRARLSLKKKNRRI
jgi:hypothetical protein